MSYRPKWWLDFLRIIWPLTTLSAKMTQWPFLGPVVSRITRPMFTGNNFHVSHIPLNISVKGAESSMLPEKVLEELIRRSSHRITINRCTCRELNKCAHYPVENACLHLGQGIAGLNSNVATQRTVEEALDHMRKMTGMGLIPMIGRVRMDDFFYGRPNTGKALTICFCCPCCCTIFKSVRYFPEDVKKSLVRLRGQRVAINSKLCLQGKCTVCIDECVGRAISRGQNGLVWNSALCIGCGLCARVCPEKAVSIEVDDINSAIDDVMGRINARVNIE